MITLHCQKCGRLSEGYATKLGIVCLLCETPSDSWQELVVDSTTEDLPFDPLS